MIFNATLSVAILILKMLGRVILYKILVNRSASLCNDHLIALNHIKSQSTILAPDCITHLTTACIYFITWIVKRTIWPPMRSCVNRHRLSYYVYFVTNISKINKRLTYSIHGHKIPSFCNSHIILAEARCS